MDYRRIFVNMTHGAIGDTLYSFPLLRALRRSCPDSEIHVATWFYIRGVLDLETEARVAPLVIKDLRTEIAYRLSLMPDFDLAINLNYDRLSLIETVATGASVRVGSETAGGPAWWLTHRLPIDGNRHKLDEVLDMGEAAGIPRPDGPFTITVPSDSRWSASVSGHCDRLKARGLKIIGVHPGAKYESRMWPVERFRDLCRRLIGDHKAVLFLFGAGYRQAPGDVKIIDTKRIDTIKDGLGDLAPMAVDSRTIIPPGDFTALATLLKHLDLYVGHDTGPTHLAALVGCPVVDIMGHGLLHRWRPLGQKVAVIYRPPAGGDAAPEGGGEREKRQLATIEVDEVLAEALRLLGV